MAVNREYELAQHHWEQVNAAYLKPDNAGLAVWCMYDFNTLHFQYEPGIGWFGVADLFRIPKYSYYWYQSELTSKPMAYVMHIDATHAGIFSNCEQIRLWEDRGKGYQSSMTQKPDTSFISSTGKPINYALHHPPFTFTVSAGAKALKAEGLIGGKVQTVFEWKQPGIPTALKLEADRPTITADGSDLSRIIVSLVDTNGTVVEGNLPVSFKLEGIGQLIGENPVRLRAGKMIILVQSGFIPGELK
jgi:beta-galactosidase